MTIKNPLTEDCKHCGSLITEQFCPNCGQRRFSRIDKKYIIDEFQNVFLQANKGFLFSLIKVIKNPGKTAREFIDGDRVSHYKPLLLLFVFSTISTFITFKLLHFDDELKKQDYNNSELMADYMNLLTNYSTFINMFLIPFFALTSYWAFKKWGHNYFEHIILNAYFYVYYSFLTLVFIIPFSYIFKDNDSVNVITSVLTFLILPFIMTWFYKGVYIEKPLKPIIGRVLLTLFLFFVIFVLFIIISIIIVTIYAIVYDPNILEYLKPNK